MPYEALATIRDEVEEMPTLYCVDIVDFARVPKKFRSVAQERVLLEEIV